MNIGLPCKIFQYLYHVQGILSLLDQEEKVKRPH